ncbi:MAG: DMT family transporter [Anaerolineae bacterium]|nr:DMT family transporter [Anaerolineae bacterium]
MPIIVLVVLFGLLGGIAVGLQGPLSSIITERLGVMESIFIVHIGGALIIGVPLLMRGGGKLAQWRDVPWYALIAGGFGLVIIAAISFAIPRVGIAVTVTLVVAGQLILSAALDHFGWLGATPRPMDVQRIIGMLVLFAGVWLIVRK